MSTVYLADTGVFVRAGGSTNEKFRRLRQAVRQANASIQMPRRVLDELGGDLDDWPYPSSAGGWQQGIDEGWIVVAGELDYANPVVSTVMDGARRFIANKTGRDESDIEQTDAALVGLAGQLLDSGEASTVVLLSTDKPAGHAAETILSDTGFRGQIEYRYVSPSYLETITVDDFSD